MSDLKTTGKYTYKPYKCKACGTVKQIGTNHWGDCYSIGSYNACMQCPPYKRPTTWECMEPVPEGYTKPAPWQVMKVQ